MKGQLFISAVFVLLVASCNNSQKEKINDVANEQQQQQNVDSNSATATITLPSFSVQDVNGNIVNLQSFRGKKVFVNLWASWCPPCKKEMPSIEKLSRIVDTSKVKFVMISYDDQFEKAKNYIASKGYKFSIYFPVENPPALFNVQAIPNTFIFNESGELIKQIEGGENYDTKEYRDLLQYSSGR